MAQLIVRNVNDRIAENLKRVAKKHGFSAEEEHRQILKKALADGPEELSFKELLQAIPDVGEDSDFERIPQTPREVEL